MARERLSNETERQPSQCQATSPVSQWPVLQSALTLERGGSCVQGHSTAYNMSERCRLGWTCKVREYHLTTEPPVRAWTSSEDTAF